MNGWVSFQRHSYAILMTFDVNLLYQADSYPLVKDKESDTVVYTKGMKALISKMVSRTGQQFVHGLGVGM